MPSGTPLAGTRHTAVVVGVAAKVPTTVQVQGHVGLLGAASTVPEAVAAEGFVAERVEHEQRERMVRVPVGDVGSTAEQTAEGWGKAMARLLMERWVSLAGFVLVAGNRRRRWGHWSVSYRRPTQGRSVVAEEVTDGSFGG